MRDRPYHLFLLLGVVFLILSLFQKNDSTTIDIQLHDSYFVIYHYHVFFGIFLLLFLFWIIYLLTHKILWSYRLTWAHTILTVVCIVLILIGMPALTDFYTSNAPKRYYSFYETTGTVMTWQTIILILAQPIFLFNIIGGFIKRSF